MSAAARLEAYLLTNIPLAGAMALTVINASTQSVKLSAPLAPNQNHRDTAFGGSIASLATLACWGLAHELVEDSGFGAAHLVVKRSVIDYLAPVSASFESVSTLDDASRWTRCEKALQRGRPARLILHSQTYSDDRKVADFEGEFAILPTA